MSPKDPRDQAEELRAIAQHLRTFPSELAKGVNDVYLCNQAGIYLVEAIKCGAFAGPKWLVFRREVKTWLGQDGTWWAFAEAAGWLRENAKSLSITFDWSAEDETGHGQVKFGCPLLADLLDRQADELIAQSQHLSEPVVNGGKRGRSPHLGSLPDQLAHLCDELERYIDDNVGGSGLEGNYPPINPGHPVHVAVCAVERFFPSGRLPLPARLHWAELVMLSRKGGVQHKAGFKAHDLFNALNALKAAPPVTEQFTGKHHIMPARPTAPAPLAIEQLIKAFNRFETTLDATTIPHAGGGRRVEGTAHAIALSEATQRLYDASGRMHFELCHAYGTPITQSPPGVELQESDSLAGPWTSVPATGVRIAAVGVGGTGVSATLIAALEDAALVSGFPIARWNAMQARQPGADHQRWHSGDVLEAEQLAKVERASKLLRLYMQQIPAPSATNAVSTIPSELRSLQADWRRGDRSDDDTACVAGKLLMRAIAEGALKHRPRFLAEVDAAVKGEMKHQRGLPPGKINGAIASYPGPTHGFIRAVWLLLKERRGVRVGPFAENVKLYLEDGITMLAAEIVDSIDGAGTSYLVDLPCLGRDTYHDNLYHHPSPIKGHLGNAESPEIAVKGVKSPNGVSMHPLRGRPAVIQYEIRGRYSWFTGKVALNDTAFGHNWTSVKFRVNGDGRKLWESDSVERAGEPQDFSFSVEGVQCLELRVRAEGQEVHGCHAVWIEPHLLVTSEPPAAAAPVKMQPQRTLGGDPAAVDDEDLRILNAMATKPTLIWTQERIETCAKNLRLPVSRATISKHWPHLVTQGLIEKVPRRKGRRILKAGLDIVAANMGAKSADIQASSEPTRKKARPLPQPGA